MTKGTALFDTVAISGTETQVRAGQGGCAVGADVGGRGAGPIAMGRGCAGCAQDGGGVVDMDDGAVTFKGGSISNSRAVRAPSASRASARRGMVCCAVRHGRWMARTVRRTHAAASGVRCTAHAAGVERVRTPFESLAKGRPHRDAECCTPRVRDTMRVRSAHTAWRGFQTGRMHASARVA